MLLWVRVVLVHDELGHLELDEVLELAGDQEPVNLVHGALLHHRLHLGLHRQVARGQGKLGKR